MKAYSLDLRQRIVAAVEAGDSPAEVAEVFGVAVSTVYRYLALQDSQGNLTPKPIPGRPRSISSKDTPALIAQLEAAPDAILAEHCATWQQTQGTTVSITTMHRAIARVRWTLKKRSSTPANKTQKHAPSGAKLVAISLEKT